MENTISTHGGIGGQLPRPGEKPYRPFSDRPKKDRGGFIKDEPRSYVPFDPNTYNGPKH